MPAALAQSVRGLAGDQSIPEALRNGAVDPNQSRLLLADIGPVHGGLYAFPSAKGRTCYALEGGPQSCHHRFTLEQPVGVTIYDPDGFNRGVPMGMFGLVPNNVVAVDIVVDGRSYAARLGENAYFLELPTGLWTRLEIVSTYRSGTAVRTLVSNLMPH
jgi:hypothetical protein